MIKQSLTPIVRVSALLGVCACLFGLSPARGADVITYELTKGSNYVQTSSDPGVPIAGNPVSATANVYLTAAGAGTAALIGPNGNPTVVLNQQTNLPNLQLQYLAPFASRVDMDSQFPDGPYTLRLVTVHDGTIDAQLSVTGGFYPNVPRVSNYDAAQLINPTADFTFSWDPLLNVGANDFIYWEVRELPGGGGAAVVARSPLPNETGALPGGTVQSTIPGGILQTNHGYALQLWFYRFVFVQTGAYPPVPGYSGYSTTTVLPIQTVGSNGAPVITSSPTNLTLNVGATATFRVAAAGAAPIYYQWQSGGVNIADATNATLTLKSVQTNQAGTYTAIASNAAGFAVSSPATLVVIPPNPLAFAQGSYNGLFFVPGTNTVTEESSGYFSASVTPKLTFSAKLQSAGKTFSCSGQIGPDGKATNSIARRGLTPLTVEIQVDAGGGDQLIGTVRGDGWAADLLAYQALFNAKTNPAPRAGKYTLIFPGAADPATAPSGYSFGAVTIDPSGKVRWSGTLSDGTKVSQATSVSTNGQWPLFSALYSRQGSILSWITLADSDVSDFTGAVTWIKPAQAKSKVYPGGFQLAAPVVGSLYLPPSKGSQVLNFKDGIVSLSLTNSGPNITNQISLGPNNKIINASPNKLSLAVALGTGLFSGKVTDPLTGKPIAIKGAVLQRQNDGFGYFLNPTLSGPVFLGD